MVVEGVVGVLWRTVAAWIAHLFVGAFRKWRERGIIRVPARMTVIAAPPEVRTTND